MGSENYDRYCNGCRARVTDCECDYERCEECDSHYDACTCADDEAVCLLNACPDLYPDAEAQEYDRVAAKWAVPVEMLKRIHRAMLRGEL